MVARSSIHVHLKPGVEAEGDLEVSCVNMEKEVPSASDAFTVSKALASKDLLQLLQLKGFMDEPLRIQ